MKNYFEIETMEQLRALADPLRRRLLELFATEAATTKQVATKLGEKPTRLYHHVDLLFQTGLIELVRTQQNRGTVEKYFIAAAQKFVVCRDLIELNKESVGEPAGVVGLLSNAIEETANRLKENLNRDLVNSNSKDRAIAVLSDSVLLNATEVKELSEMVQAWLDTRSHSDRKGRATHCVSMFVFPDSYGDEKP